MYSALVYIPILLANACGRRWKFQNSALFPRLDLFLERMYDLLDLTKTVTQFQKLERVEIGGNKGHALTTYVETTYKDFNKELARWASCGYDVLDVSQQQFATDFATFRSRVKELEQERAAAAAQRAAAWACDSAAGACHPCGGRGHEAAPPAVVRH